MLLVIIVLILLLGGFGYGGYSYNWHAGYPAPYYGGLGLVVALLLLVVLFRGGW
jgi:hypothetical protein